MTWQKKVSLVIVGILCCLKYSFASFMPAWQAFQVSLEAESTQAIWVKFNIAPEYHLYQNKINPLSQP